MWAENSVFYQIYPLGMCDAPHENKAADDLEGLKEEESIHRILRVIDFIPHLKKLGIDAVYFSPIFQSDCHGYDTRDYRKIDSRLGTNDDFKTVVEKLHENDIKVIIDGVFNHVGRGFFGFLDVLKNREGSQYKDWFNINFGGSDAYGDNLWYEGWEGCYDLVKLNLRNPAVSDYLIESVRGWVNEFDIDGLRLDVAYMVDRDFLKRLRWETSQMKNDFFLLGEILGGDYRTIMNDEMCHSATNYECFKGIWSAINSDNLFEIMHSIKRQFGPEEWTLYKGMHPVSFVDNHDVSRIASTLKEERLIIPAYALSFSMPGIPMVYYGSEWGIKGDKKDGDWTLRPAVKTPEWNYITDAVAGLSRAVHENSALSYGGIDVPILQNKQTVFERNDGSNRVIVAINIDDNDFRANFDARAGRGFDYISGEYKDFGGGLLVPPKTAFVMGKLD